MHGKILIVVCLQENNNIGLEQRRKQLVTAQAQSAGELGSTFTVFMG